MRVLCSEPLLFRPWDVRRLTPFQVRRVLLVERDKRGMVLLDLPADDGEPPETDMRVEWRSHFIQAGVTDPDAVRILVERAMADDECKLLAEPVGGVDGPDE